MGPLVSVIITSYQGSDSIERAILSVCNQTYQNIEIFVVDDNGIGTEEQIATKKIVTKFPQINYIAHQKNMNGSNARNTGASKANGDFLCFLDDDDEYLPNKVALQVNKMLQLDSEYGLVYCSYIDISNSGKQTTEIACRRGYILEYSLLDRVKVATSLFMVKRSVFLKLNGFDGSFRRHQDWEFVARLTARYKVDYVDEICVIKHSIDRNVPKKVDDVEKYRLHYLNKLNKIIEQLSRHMQKKVYCYHYLCFVKEYVKQHNYIKFFEYLRKSKAPFMYIFMFTRDCFKSSINKRRR